MPEGLIRQHRGGVLEQKREMLGCNASQRGDVGFSSQVHLVAPHYTGPQ